MKKAEEFLLEFHERHPGCTRVAFENGLCTETGSSSYELLSSLAGEDRVLDMGCGDGHLLSLLAASRHDSDAIGVDMSPGELHEASQITSSALVRARAQTLPFRAASFSLVLSHFAFHLMSNLAGVVNELARVLAPGGRFAAIVGGGPKVGDPFERFLELLSSTQRADQKVPPLGERQGRTDEGLRSLFLRCHAFANEIAIEDFYVDFGGNFDDTWRRLSTIYDLMHYSERELTELREGFRHSLGPVADGVIPCTMAVRRVIAHRTWR